MSLCQDVVNASRPYLGPTTEQFIARQCKAHLNVAPEGLTKQHLPELAKWVELSCGLSMDASKAKELGAKIARL